MGEYKTPGVYIKEKSAFGSGSRNSRSCLYRSDRKVSERK